MIAYPQGATSASLEALQGKMAAKASCTMGWTQITKMATPLGAPTNAAQTLWGAIAIQQ